MTNGQRVLVVDGLSETEEVLKAVLEPQGLEVNRIRTHFAESSHAPQTPHVVILHEDQSAPASSASGSDSWPDIPRVIIGSLTLPPSQPQADVPSASRARYLSHPFQYRDLIQAVENLLAE